MQVRTQALIYLNSQVGGYFQSQGISVQPCLGTNKGAEAYT